jgi:diguanylate cyclase (GGDEF)-like protein
MFAAWALAQAIIATSVALTGHLTEITLCWLAIPVTTLSARFSTRGITAGVVLTLALMAGVLLAADTAAVLREPPLLLAPAAVVLATAMLSTALMRSDLEHREGTLIDPLTGMLNVNALRRRAEELAQQSEINGAPVGVIAADIDKFKAVNDSRGHAAGDTVLKEVAYQLRKSGRSFELAHRCGGDEFVILVPGANLIECRRQAEAMRQAIEQMALVEGQRVTMSFGVATSRPGASFDYATVYARADAALYEAKRSGRNCVCTTAQPVATVAVASRQQAWREAAMSAQTPG